MDFGIIKMGRFESQLTWTSQLFRLSIKWGVCGVCDLLRSQRRRAKVTLVK